AQRLAEQYPDLPVELRGLSQTQLRDIFRAVLRSSSRTELPSVVRSMVEVHERAAVRPLSVPLRGAFLALYAGAVALTLVSGSIAALPVIVLPHPSTGSQDEPREDQGPTLRRS